MERNKQEYTVMSMVIVKLLTLKYKEEGQDLGLQDLGLQDSYIGCTHESVPTSQLHVLLEGAQSIGDGRLIESITRMIQLLCTHPW